MNHKDYHKLLIDIKYSGWILLAEVIIAALFVGFIVFKLN